MKTFAVFVTITGLTVLSAQTGSDVKIKKVPTVATSANSGVAMFKEYCAVCHGLDGKGQGPAAAALTVAPVDLTMLKQKNGGKFPSLKISQVIQGSDAVKAHGTTEMPIWGPIFRTMDNGNTAVSQLRVANLTHYISSLQK
jgi:mono/diheme cytochrome c family protein